MQGNAQQPAFAVRVDGEVEDHAADRAVGHALDLPARFLRDEDVVRSDERHCNRLTETADDGRHGQAGIHERGNLGLCVICVPQRADGDGQPDRD